MTCASAASLSLADGKVHVFTAIFLLLCKRQADAVQAL
jgi:hypothetical protein